jgi:rhodanese-related sulfurtransferase
MKALSVSELARWRKESEPFVLLDVREPDELRRASIDGALHIPMREVPARLNDLQPTARIAVLCHHGGRSEQVARFLSARGFSDVHNVAGGIDAYARQVDDSIPRY